MSASSLLHLLGAALLISGGYLAGYTAATRKALLQSRRLLDLLPPVTNTEGRNARN